MTQMRAVDAFLRRFTSPRLSRYDNGEATFSKVGLEVIEETRSVQDLVDRNVSSGSDFRASFDV